MEKLLLIGASQMAIDYTKVLKDLDITPIVIGRGEQSASLFENATKLKVFRNGLVEYLVSGGEIPSRAIIAVGVEELNGTCRVLIENGCKEILLEKPGGISLHQLETLHALALTYNANVYIAYNRRYYASTLALQKLVADEGGVKSFNFEFTEWSHKIEPLEKKGGVKETWFFSNSTHVVDLAFFLGGKPVEFSAYSSTPLDWHEASIFAGSGKSENEALFTYQANWKSAGRWSVEVLTSYNRYYLKPLEELYRQKVGTLMIDQVEIEDNLDKMYKPGLYLQVMSFINHDILSLKTLAEQVSDMKLYIRMLQGGQ